MFLGSKHLIKVLIVLFFIFFGFEELNAQKHNFVVDGIEWEVKNPALTKMDWVVGDEGGSIYTFSEIKTQLEKRKGWRLPTKE
jgi:hypothetical protein